MSQLPFTILFHHSPCTLLKEQSQLQELHKLTINIFQEMKEGLQKFFVERDYSYFDPHVGDTACQIRAHMLASLHNQYKDKYIAEYLKINEIINEKLEFLAKVNTNNYLLTTKKNKEIRFFLEYLKADFCLEKEFIILFLCYFLSKYKVAISHKTDVIDVKSVQIFYNLKRKQAKKYIHYLKKLLADFSCEYILMLANNQKRNSSLIQVLPCLCLNDDDSRQVLPCYWTMKVLTSKLLTMEVPLFVFIKYQFQNAYKRIFVLYEKCKKNQYHPKFLDNLYDLPSCYIIQAEAVQQSDMGTGTDEQGYIRELLKHDIINLILAYMAAHPQYSGKKLAHLADDPLHKLNYQEYGHITTWMNLEFLKMKRLAKQLGCIHTNKNLFFIQHIFFGNTKQVLERLSIDHLSDSQKVDLLYNK